MPGISYPMINGNRFDFSSVQFTIAGVTFNGVADVNYKHALKPGELRGTRSKMIGRTRGKYEASGDITLFKSEFQQLVTLLGSQGLGYMETSFDIIVTYNELGNVPVTDTLVGCRITDDSDSGKEGGDPTQVKLELNIMYMLRNGVSPLALTQMQK